MDYASLSASERRFLPPAVAVSTVAFALYPPSGAVIGEDRAPDGVAGPEERPLGEESGPVTLWIPLVRRTRQPFAGEWALPGGPIPWNETLSDSAERTLRSTVGRDPGYLEQLFAFGEVERSGQAQRLVTIAYWALYGEAELVAPRPTMIADPVTPPREPAVLRSAPRWDDPEPGGALRLEITTPVSAPHAEPSTLGDSEHSATVGPENVAWFSADRLPALAFDHTDIVEYALWRLRMKTEYTAVAHRFLGPVFTLAQLRRVHEAVLGHEVDPANFRRQALAQGHLIDTGETQVGTRHRPAKLYRFRGAPDDHRAPGRSTT